MPRLRINYILITLAVCATLSAMPPAALAQDRSENDGAQEAPIDIIPASSLQDSDIIVSESEDTHVPLKLTPDKSELIRLPKKAGSIIIGNPAHLSILADSAQTLVLVPKLPGATYMIVLDLEGNLIMQRHVLVDTPKDKYVRIRKSCAGGVEGCQTTKVYFCPDMCHEVSITQPGEETESAQQEAAAGIASDLAPSSQDTNTEQPTAN